MKSFLAFVFSICLAPFPSFAIAQLQGGEAVTFESISTDEKKTTLRGVLYKPSAAPRGGVVLVHGSGGWSDEREGHYGRAFSAAGYVVVAIDSFGPRGLSSTIQDQSRLSSLNMTQDAFAARRVLIDHGVDPKRTAVMGFSKGGQVALFAADRNFLPKETEGFSVAIPFYPGCNVRPREPKPIASMLMVLGEKDDYTGVKPCQDLAADFVRAGGQAKVNVYPGATHAFDGNPEHIRAFTITAAETYINCIAEMDNEGQLHYAGKKFAKEDPSIQTEFKKTCMRRGATVWTNVAQKKKATEDVIQFLNTAYPQ